MYLTFLLTFTFNTRLQQDFTCPLLYWKCSNFCCCLLPAPCQPAPISRTMSADTSLTVRSRETDGGRTRITAGTKSQEDMLILTQTVISFRKFWHCERGVGHHLACEDDMLFDLRYTGCNYAAQTDCGERYLSFWDDQELILWMVAYLI